MSALGGNADFDWDSFDSDAYYAHNYASLRHDDRRGAELIRDHFARADFPPGARGIDVGTGPNLYPALSMLPFVDSVVLHDYSARNIAWLHNQQASGWPMWDNGLSEFWKVYQRDTAYAEVDGRRLLDNRIEIAQGSVFDLSPAALGTFDAGTMFFVADLLTDEYAEFADAVARFLSVLRPGAPFAAAFMEGSQGYSIGGIRFPSTPVGVEELRGELGRAGDRLEFERIGAHHGVLRAGYTEMIIATGFAR